MTRIRLRVYSLPGRAEVFVNFKGKDGGIKRMAVIVDTGAEVSLLPRQLMEDIAYQPVTGIPITVEQAGIAGHEFEALEALVTVSLEDETGSRTSDFDIRVLFAGTTYFLAGFGGILDRAVLHLDMPNLAGYLDIDV